MHAASADVAALPSRMPGLVSGAGHISAIESACLYPRF